MAVSSPCSILNHKYFIYRFNSPVYIELISPLSRKIIPASTGFLSIDMILYSKISKILAKIRNTKEIIIVDAIQLCNDVWKLNNDSLFGEIFMPVKRTWMTKGRHRVQNADSSQIFQTIFPRNRNKLMACVVSRTKLEDEIRARKELWSARVPLLACQAGVSLINFLFQPLCLYWIE